MRATGATKRQLQWWHQNKLVPPTVIGPQIYGEGHRYDAHAVMRALAVKRLLECGMVAPQIRRALKGATFTPWMVYRPGDRLRAIDPKDIVGDITAISGPVILLRLKPLA